MSDKIPLAKDLLSERVDLQWTVSRGSELAIQEAMIEFAKLHVKAALEAAINDSPSEAELSISSAYPLENIK